MNKHIVIKCRTGDVLRIYTNDRDWLYFSSTNRAYSFDLSSEDGIESIRTIIKTLKEAIGEE